MKLADLQRSVFDHLFYTCAKDLKHATTHDVFRAIALATRDRIVERWLATERAYERSGARRVCYLSAEFLLGRALSQNLINLGLYDVAEETLAKYDIDLTRVLEEELDPGLGNGGLGRLAACFMDSLATLELPAIGYGIRYEFGIFDQKVESGWQIEQGDDWLRRGNPWEIAHLELHVPVQFYGRVRQIQDSSGNLRSQWVETEEVIGVPHDMPILGYDNNTVNTLRLWSAKASKSFNFKVFNDGDYRRAVEKKTQTETISKVLYPNDRSEEGRELRLKQQYFFVCCSITDILRRFRKRHDSLEELPDFVTIQLNDTHPAITIAELMRVLVDVELLPWEKAWNITQRCVAYTNHTLLPEALEKWPVKMFERLLPRHLQIIYEINRRFLLDVHVKWPGDNDRKRRMSIIEEGSDKQINMAHLAVVGSKSVNGVAELHSRLITTQLLPDFYQMYPDRFNNKTNGVTPRRWLKQCNPRLANLITERIGDEWVADFGQIVKLLEYVEDEEFQKSCRQIKRWNKSRLARIIQEEHGFRADLDSIFDVQVKRLHEYKRQLLNCLHIIALYQKLKEEPGLDLTPRTFIFGGKAAPGYTMAKLHIKLINDVAEIVNNDPAIDGRLKVCFLANYNVSLAEVIIPAADLSEQISVAGKEASGTGNMKFAMNGALTIGTLDGANIEIRREVGEENFFRFGMDVDEVRDLRKRGYDPAAHIAKSETLQKAIGLLRDGFFSPDDPGRFMPVVEDLTQRDPYMVCADFDDYMRVQEDVAAAFDAPETWWPSVIRNIANMGKFSSDRTISQYAEDIWGIEPVRVELKDR